MFTSLLYLIYVFIFIRKILPEIDILLKISLIGINEVRLIFCSNTAMEDIFIYT